MKKINFKDKKLAKILFIFAYIEILTFIITNYMEKLEKMFNVDFHLKHTYFKFNAPLILISNFKILLILIFITCMIYLIIYNYKKSIRNANEELEGIKYKEKDGTHGTAGFSNPHEMKDILKIGNEQNINGIILGKTIDTDEIIILPDSYKKLNRNIVILGASRFRKIKKIYYS